MNADSFLTTKCTSFSLTQNKLRSHSIQYKQLDISLTIPNQKEVSEKQREKRRSIQITSNLHQNVNINLLFTKQIIEQLMWRQSELYMNQFQIQLSYIVDSGNLQQFGAIVCMTADVLLKIKDYNNACYYYNQYRIFNTLTKNHAEKAKALIGLANCATEVKLNSEALILLKKALQYAWLSKEYELQIYEKFALNYYYLGQSEEQYYFHERGLLGILESDESPIKQFSCESLKDQMKRNNIEIKTLCPQLLNYMNLPVLSRNELLSSNQNSIRGVQVKKQVVYTVTEQVEILLQKNDEFQHQINTPKHQKLVKPQNGKKGDEFRVVNFSFSAYSKERRNYDLTDTTIYKLPYEVQVNNRLRYPYIPEDINAKIHEQLRNTNRTQKFGLRNKGRYALQEEWSLYVKITICYILILFPFIQLNILSIMGICPLKEDGTEVEDSKTDCSNRLPLDAKQIKLNDQLNMVCLEDFIFTKVVGRGSFGKVMLVQHKMTKRYYAMKILRKDIIKQKGQQIHTMNERQILEVAQHPFIVQLHFAFQTPEKLYLVTDFLAGGELFYHLRKSKKFPEERMKLYAAELILALDYLHQKGIIYRDLKPENILIGADGHLKLTDFGLSRINLKEGERTYTFCGTPEYLAPEILLGQGHDQSADWWSLGALLYEMIAGAPPFYSNDKGMMFRNRLEKKIEMKPWFSKEASSLLTELLINEPTKRITIDQIKAHPFFDSFSWDDVYYKKVKPLFIPKIIDELDLQNIDPVFTEEEITDTPIDSLKVGTFDKFTYANSQIFKQ